MKKLPEQSEPLSRRHFLRDAALAAMSAALLPEGLIPVVLADDTSVIPGKPGLTLLNDRPINAGDTGAPARRSHHTCIAFVCAQQRCAAGH